MKHKYEYMIFAMVAWLFISGTVFVVHRAVVELKQFEMNGTTATQIQYE